MKYHKGKIAVGAITVGQSPRIDVIPEMQALLPAHITLVESGALDGMTRQEIENLPRSQDDYILVSRLADGSSVSFAESQIIPKVQNCITDLERRGVVCNILICTGQFEDSFQTQKPLLFPEEILLANVKVLLHQGRLGIVTPLAEQNQQSLAKWTPATQDVVFVNASPYDGIDGVKKAAMQLSQQQPDLIVLDCIGYNGAMKQAVQDICSCPVIIARSLMARILCELYS